MKYSPHEYQRYATEYIETHPVAAVLLSMGLGLSLIHILLELVEGAKKSCKDPVVLIEQRLDFSRFVKNGFGTGDCVIIADGTLDIVDYKHGKGVEVSAVENPQMMLYALGALELFDGIYDIDTCLLYTSEKQPDPAFG